MTNKTLIFGSRSNLSNKLKENINNSELISSEAVLNNKNYLEKFKSSENINIVINSFYPASRLNNFFEPEMYIRSSILTLAVVLEQIKKFQLNIGRLLYSSSASVYGINSLCNEGDALMPLNLHSSLKISSEKLVEGFCREMNIDFIIARIFNMYGGDDKFSVISKIINTSLSKKTLHLVNYGESIRDYIHINDVVSCYKLMLAGNAHGVINVATGKGESIKNILDFLKVEGVNNFSIKHHKKLEVEISIANTNKLSDIIDFSNFIDILDYVALKVKKRL
jgi:nucleoside-diphosphate-sugar epimerase